MRCWSVTWRAAKPLATVMPHVWPAHRTWPWRSGTAPAPRMRPPLPLPDLPAAVLADGAGATGSRRWRRSPVLGEIAWQEDGSVSLVLAGGTRTEPLSVAEIEGRLDVPGDRPRRARDGRRVDLSDAGYTYAVDWRPDLGQLGLW